jgi:hypothetical protein
MTTMDSDYWEIAAVKARYFRFMDLKQWAELRAVFTDDAVFEHPTVGDYDDIDAAMVALEAAIGSRWTSHEGGIPEITIAGPDRASGIFAMTGHALSDDDQMGRTFGHYYDEFRKAEGVWKMSRMRLVSTLRTVQS